MQFTLEKKFCKNTLQVSNTMYILMNGSNSYKIYNNKMIKLLLLSLQ